MSYSVFVSVSFIDTNWRFKCLDNSVFSLFPQDCLSEAAIETKFKRHSYECEKVSRKMKHFLGQLLEETTAKL